MGKFIKRNLIDMKHLYKICSFLAAGLFILFFSNASTGPGLSFGSGYTNAPFDGGYCNGCHGGGSYTPNLTIELWDATNTPVTTYNPGGSYTVHLDLSTSTGSNPMFGFQVVGVRTSDNGNVGSWGSLTNTDYHAVTINSKVYVEHSDRLSSGIIDLPWTAPAAGNGQIKFYAAGNVVNFDFSTSGDNPTFSSLTISQAPLAVTWLYFNGKAAGNTVKLEWAVTDAAENGEFILEKSQNGKDFAPIYSVKSHEAFRNDNNYIFSYTDTRPYATNYYRVKEKTVDGMESTYKTLEVRLPIDNTTLVYINGKDIVVELNSLTNEAANMSVISIDGRKINSSPVNLVQGKNVLKIDKPSVPGIYLVNISSANMVFLKEKFLVE
jgi:hypothetical protein